jgi:hypothetical protein
MDKERCLKEVLSVYFGMNKYPSFTRRLKRWAFVHHQRSRTAACYFHPLFTRTNPPTKCLNIRCFRQRRYGPATTIRMGLPDTANKLVLNCCEDKNSTREGKQQRCCERWTPANKKNPVADITSTIHNNTNASGTSIAHHNKLVDGGISSANDAGQECSKDCMPVLPLPPPILVEEQNVLQSCYARSPPASTNNTSTHDEKIGRFPARRAHPTDLRAHDIVAKHQILLVECASDQPSSSLGFIPAGQYFFTPTAPASLHQIPSRSFQQNLKGYNPLSQEINITSSTKNNRIFTSGVGAHPSSSSLYYPRAAGLEQMRSHNNSYFSSCAGDQEGRIGNGGSSTSFLASSPLLNKLMTGRRGVITRSPPTSSMPPTMAPVVNDHHDEHHRLFQAPSQKIVLFPPNMRNNCHRGY